MRKTMTREITKTTVELGKIKMVDGNPKVEQLPTETMLGNVSMEKAQKKLNKKYNEPVTIFSVEANTTTYEMPVETFMQYATVKEPVENN